MFLAFFIIHIHIIVLLIRNALHNKQANKSNVYPHHQIESNCFLNWIFLFSTEMMMMVDSGHSVSVWLTDKKNLFFKFFINFKTTTLLFGLLSQVHWIHFALLLPKKYCVIIHFIRFDDWIELCLMNDFLLSIVYFKY